MAATSPCTYTLYGGSRGGGKTDCVIGRQIRGAEKYASKWNGLIIRRKYKDFQELRRRIDELIEAGLPAERIGGDQQLNVVRFANGALVTCMAIGRIEDAQDLQGQQYTEITVDEATTLPFFSGLVEKLKGCLRSPHGVPCRMFFTGNPGGPGHMQVKSLFIDPSPPNKFFRDAAGESLVFIPSKVLDNIILCEKDPSYVNRLTSIQDPSLRRAWLDGDWEVFLGQAFGWDQRYHVIAPVPIPPHAPMYTTFDWGYGKPFDWAWYWVDSDNRIYRCGEWYGSSTDNDEGLRMPDSAIAEGLLERERKLGIAGRTIIRLAGPDCFAKKPDYRGGGQGPSTAEVFAQYGLYLSPGDPSRELKIRQMRERMRIPRDSDGRVTGLPMLVAYSTCKDYIRTIPALCMDQTNPEDIDTGQEDHAYDSVCHVVMARPLNAAAQYERASGLAASEAGAKRWAI